MLAAALQAEVAAYIDQFAGVLDEDGRRWWSATAPPTADGADQRRGGGGDRAAGERQARRPGHWRSGRFFDDPAAVGAQDAAGQRGVPLLYLHGLSSRGLRARARAVPRLAGPGCPAADGDQADRDSGATRRRHSGPGTCPRRLRVPVGRRDPPEIRLGEEKLCLLVMIGVRADGRKELVALADGYRESAESWADLLRDCARRGMRAPVLAMGDGALGFWSALREVFPQARNQRCWFHKIANVLGALPKSAHPGAKKALAEIWNAEDKDHARTAVKAFEIAYGAKFPKAAAKITGDEDELLAFYDYPAEHWVHLRTTNPTSRRSPPYGSGPRSPRAPGQGRRAGDGVQAHRVRPAPLAHGQRTPPRRARPRRRDLRQRQARRTTRRPGRRGDQGGSRLTCIRTSSQGRDGGLASC